MRALIAAAFALGFAASASADTLTVGAYPANPPWEVKQEDGTFTGFEVDIARAVGERMGREVKFQDLGFQALFAAVASGRIDAAISSITVTDERLQNQDFSQPYYDSNLAMGMSETSDVATLADLEGKVVGVLSGSTGEKWVQDNGAEYGFSDVRAYDAYTQMLLDAQNGRVAAVITDLPGMLFAFTQMKGMTTGETIRTGERYAMMLKKGSDLTGPVSEALTALKEDGTLAKIHEKYFGVAPAEGSATVEVLPVPTAK